MKALGKISLLLLLLTLSSLSQSLMGEVNEASDPVVVIIHKDSEITELELSDLKQLFLREKKEIGKEKIYPVNRDSKSESYQSLIKMWLVDRLKKVA